jgi:DNA-directed RNA polymerase subunit RPC12/RpoP
MYIIIKIEIPNYGCNFCQKAYVFNRHSGLVCTAFDGVHLEKDDKGHYIRCQECIDATVKGD